MSATRWAPRVTVACVVTDAGGRYLTVEEEIAGRRVLNQPAGHLEPNEGLAAAAAREALEETGWEVRPEALVGLYRWSHPQHGTTFLRSTFAARPLRHHPERPLDREIRAVHWLTRGELEAAAERLRSPLVLAAVRDFEAGARYPLALLREIS